jgi:hypothetical protein
MVYAETVLRSIATVLVDAKQLPDDLTFATVELDQSGEHADVELPVVELTAETVDRNQSRNTERVGMVYDATNTPVGYEYAYSFDMRARMEILTAARSENDARELSQTIRFLLSEYDDHSIGNPLPDPSDDGVLDEVTEFVVGGRTTENDFSLSHALRREVFEIDCGFVHRFDETELVGERDVVTSVLTPGTDDVVQGDGADARLELETSDDI